MRAWHASATSSPPPAATPWIAATTGFREASISSSTAGREGAPGGGAASNSRMSGAAAEHAARAGDHQGRYAVVGQRLHDAVAELGAHREAQAVDRRVVQGQQGNAVMAFDRDGTGHAWLVFLLRS